MDAEVVEVLTKMKEEIEGNDMFNDDALSVQISPLAALMVADMHGQMKIILTVLDIINED